MHLLQKIINTFWLILILTLGWCVWILALTASGLKFEIALLSHFLPGTLQIQKVTGSLLGGFQLEQVTYDNPTYQLQATFNKLTLSWQNGHSEVKGTWHLKAADLNAWWAGLQGRGQAEGTLQGSLFQPHFFGKITTHSLQIAQQNLGNQAADFDLILFPNKTMQGNLTLVTQLEKLPTLTDWIKKPTGQLTLQLALKGPLLNPVITGKAHLAEGSFKFPMTAIHPNQIQLEAILHPQWKITFNGSLVSGKGKAEVDGNFQNDQLTITLHGKEILAANLTHWHVVVSPALTIQLSQQSVQIHGDILIPEALITAEQLNGTVTLPDEVVIVSPNNAPTVAPFLTELQLNILLGDNIKILTTNLKTRLAGQLRIHQLKGGPITALGELMIPKGQNIFTAYGQTLAIQSGRLFYAGGVVTNPGLAITAVKNIEAVNLEGASTNGLQPIYTGRRTLTVGVHVTGTLNAPRVNLFSTPSMNQADVLSYLVFGSPRSGITGPQASMLLSALSAVSPNTLPNTGNFTEKLQNKLGITELNLQSTQYVDPTNTTSAFSTTTAISVGKQITPKLSLHYSIGILDPVSILNLRYQINKHWALQSENSTIDQGADLLYKIERD